jgi:hypothetical protein
MTCLVVFDGWMDIARVAESAVSRVTWAWSSQSISYRMRTVHCRRICVREHLPIEAWAAADAECESCQCQHSNAKRPRSIIPIFMHERAQTNEH